MQVNQKKYNIINTKEEVNEKEKELHELEENIKRMQEEINKLKKRYSIIPLSFFKWLKIDFRASFFFQLFSFSSFSMSFFS